MTQERLTGTFDFSLEHGIARMALPASGTERASEEVNDQIQKITQDARFLVIDIPGGSACAAWDVGENSEYLSDICAQIDTCPIPVLAVLGGALTGGEVALALAAHYRLVRSDTSLHIPAIGFDAIPGGGLTQRLPRLLAPALTRQILMSGAALTLADLQEQPLTDCVFEGDPYDATEKFLSFLDGVQATANPVSERRDALEFVGQSYWLATQPEGDVNESAQALAQLLDAAVMLPFATGCDMELAAQEDINTLPQTRAKRHLWTSLRRLELANAAPENALSGQTLAVLGASSLAMQLVLLALKSGLSVRWGGSRPEALQEWSDQLYAILKQPNASSSPEDLQSRLQTGPCAKMMAGADLVLHGDPDFTQTALEARIPSISFLPGRNRRMALRFAHPIPGRGIVEMMHGPKAQPGDADAARALTRQLGKTVLQIGSVRESALATLVAEFHAVADRIVALGADPYQVDFALEKSGWTKVPFRTRDTLGLQDFANHARSAPNWSALLVEQGRSGWIADAGFYDWSDDRVAASDTVQALIDHYRVRRRFSEDQIADLLLAGMLNAALTLFEQGFVPRLSDLDVLSVRALGLAPDCGGIVYASEKTGLFPLMSRVRRWADGGQSAFDPHPFWKRAAEGNTSLYDLPAQPTALQRRVLRRARQRQA